MRKAIMYEQLVILIVCFLAGVGSFYLFAPAEITAFVRIIDSRVLEPQQSTDRQTVLLAIGSLFVVFLLGTNPFFIGIAKVIVAARICFFGLSSVLLLQSNEDVLFYSAWWFPFQFVYCMISLLFIYRLQLLANMKQKPNNSRFVKMIPYFVVYVVFIIGELVVLRYFIL